MVTYESLLLTLVAGEDFRTKIGYRIPAMNVNMAAVAAVNRLVDEVENGDRELAGARAELKDIESRPPVYGEWVVVFALGLKTPHLPQHQGEAVGGGLHVQRNGDGNGRAGLWFVARVDDLLTDGELVSEV